jgi:hypothetical protein
MTYISIYIKTYNHKYSIYIYHIRKIILFYLFKNLKSSINESNRVYPSLTFLTNEPKFLFKLASVNR